MTDDELKKWATKTSAEIVKREGVALAMSACERDEVAVEADSNLLGVAIAQAIVDAYQAGIASACQSRAENHVEVEAADLAVSAINKVMTIMNPSMSPVLPQSNPSERSKG